MLKALQDNEVSELCNKAPACIPEIIKSKVISQWLQGHWRDIIAEDNNISAGAVSNIISGWSTAIGKPEADAFRVSYEFAKRTEHRCRSGITIYRRYLQKCKEFEVTASKFATSIKEIIKASDDHHIPLSKIEEYNTEKIAKKKQLENELENLKNEISTLGNHKSEIENARDLALQEKKMADLEMKSYSNAKQVLDRNSISINEDLPKFARTVNCIAEYGYDPKRVIAEFNDIQYLANKKRALEIITKELDEGIAKLRQHESLLRDKIHYHSENLPVYNELADMGFGSSQLRTLLHMIQDIANSNGINPWLAVKKFFEDIETQYTILGFEPQIRNLKIEIQKLNDERKRGLQRLKDQPFIEPVIIGLLQLGLDEHDILKVAERCHTNLSNKDSYTEILRKEIINTLHNVMMIPIMNAGLAMRSIHN